MKNKKFSIGYKDMYNDFVKVWEKGETKKFETIEEAKNFILNNLNTENIKTFKIMKGWKIIEIIELK